MGRKHRNRAGKRGRRLDAVRGDRSSLSQQRIAELNELLKQGGMIEITGMSGDEISYIEARQLASLDIGISAAELSQLLRHVTVEEALESYTGLLDERNAADGGNRKPLISDSEE
jgi:hypothetical protein